MQDVCTLNPKIKSCCANAKPEWYCGFRSFVTVAAIEGLACPLPAANSTIFPQALEVQLDPAYFGYQVRTAHALSHFHIPICMKNTGGVRSLRDKSCPS